MDTRPHALTVARLNATALVLEAGGLDQDDEQVQAWIVVGKDRRERGRDALRAGDHWGRSDF